MRYKCVSTASFDVGRVLSNRCVTVPATIDPLTFSAVLAISINGSIEINSATKVIGNPIAGKTTSAAKVAPPPTPAIPKELTVVIKIKGARNDKLKGSMPTVGAIITASIAG